MWSTFYRHDAYRKMNGTRLENIYSRMIFHGVLLDYLNDTRGFAIQDFALPDTTIRMLQGAEFDPPHVGCTFITKTTMV